MRRECPEGYVVVDPEKWAASPYLSDAEIRELADGGLYRIGLKRETVWREENGQESLWPE